MAEQTEYQGRVLTDEIATSKAKRLLGESPDMRKFSRIPPDLLLDLAYARIRGKKSGAWKLFSDDLLNMFVGVDGYGLRMALRGEQVRKGIPSSPDAEMPQRPGFLARHIWAREQEEKYQEAKKELEAP